MELNCKHFLAIIFNNFRRGLTQQQCNDALNSILSDQGQVFTEGMVNSTEIVVHYKTNLVKVVQNQLLFRKPLMLYAGHMKC